MKNPTPYLKMRVLGAIDMAEGPSIQARIKNVSALSFADEEGHARQFTWRTIQIWHTRYKKYGVTALENAPRSDRGKTRNVKPEELLEALRASLPKAHGRTPTRALLYRLCIEQGVLTRAQIAPNTFSRLVQQFELLKTDRDCEGQHRLAFAKAHANELWQADTLYGPPVTHAGGKAPTRLALRSWKISRMGIGGRSRCVIFGGFTFTQGFFPHHSSSTQRRKKVFTSLRMFLIVTLCIGNPVFGCTSEANQSRMRAAA